MKQISVIVFLLAFVYIQLFNGLVWISYEVNKSEIIQEFCVNMDKPELKCEGTCHMKKMMITEESEQKNEPKVLIPQTILFFNLFPIEIENTVSEHKNFYREENLYSFDFLNELEIPPEFS